MGNKLASNDETASLIEKYGRYITYPTAAELTTASVRTLKRETAAGNLPCYKIGRARALRVKTEDALKLIQQVA